MEKLPDPHIAEVNPTSTQPPVPSAEINFNREVLSVAGDHLQVATHGVAAWVARKRMERAGKVMERMDHKDALYEDIANAAHMIVAEPAATVSGEPAKPRTFVERHMDKRAEGKSWKAALKKAQKDIEIQQFGGTGYTSTMGRKSKKADKKRRHQVEKSYRSGELTAHERRTELDSIKATPTKVENRRAKQLRKQEKQAYKDIDKAVSQPILSRWRSHRRDRAIEGIKKHHHRAEYHKSRVQSIRTGEDVTYEIHRSKSREIAGSLTKGAGRAAKYGAQVAGRITEKTLEARDKYVASVKTAYREGITSDESEYGFVQRQVGRGARASGRRVGRFINDSEAQQPSETYQRPKLETKIVVGPDGVERTIPVRPNTRARQNAKTTARTTRDKASRQTRTARGRRYQEQQEKNARGIV